MLQTILNLFKLLKQIKVNQREKTYKEHIKTLTGKLKQAVARSEFAEESVQKLLKEADHLEDELIRRSLLV